MRASWRTSTTLKMPTSRAVLGADNTDAASSQRQPGLGRQCADGSIVHLAPQGEPVMQTHRRQRTLGSGQARRVLSLTVTNHGDRATRPQATAVADVALRASARSWCLLTTLPTLAVARWSRTSPGGAVPRRGARPVRTPGHRPAGSSGSSFPTIAYRRPYCAPQRRSSSSSGARERPSAVREYSTLGGTSG
jgi:hypothetical protein